MTVYVGMDVHRKRSQVAVVDQAGAVQRNRNVPTTPPTSSRSLACSRPAPRWRWRPPPGGAGWSTSWATSSSRRIWSIPAAASRSRRPGSRTTKVDAETLAQLLRADLLPEAPVSPQPVRDLRGLLRHRASLVRLTTSLQEPGPTRARQGSAR